MRILLVAALFSGLTACSRGDDKKAETPPEAEAEVKPALGVGDPAPPLTAGKWLNGEEVKGYEAGKVYVVDFWAIWCGPCIQMMPHLAETATKYKDQGLVVVAATTVDQQNPLKLIQEFVTKNGPKLGFPFAVSETDTLDKNYMEAAGRNTLPSTFVIDKAGRIAFIGHPLQLDDVLPAVLAGTWKGKEDADAVEKLTEDMQNAFARASKDPAGALADLTSIETKYPAKKAQADFQVSKLELLALAGRHDEAKSLTETLLPSLIESRSVGLLSNVRVIWSSQQLNPEKKHVGLALKAAEGLLKVQGDTNWQALISAAEAHHASGEKEKAVEFAEKAIKHAEDDDQKKFLKDQLERYKK